MIGVCALAEMPVKGELFMQATIGALCLAAMTIGVVHTLLGPDHYLPFLAMSRAGKWSLPKTILITALCGVGHVLGSVVIGLVGVALGVSLFRLESLESQRGDVAGWLLLAFGLAYMVWGIHRAARRRPHTHWHAHDDGTVHTHEHAHVEGHAHVHLAPFAEETAGQVMVERSEWHLHPASRESAARARLNDTGGTLLAAHGDGTARASLTPWVLFTIFVFGPCEPLIPLLMFPAAQASWWGVILVAACFGVATIGTMVTVVVLATVGLGSLRFRWLERYSHATAGFVVACCGAAIKAGL